MIEEGLKQGRLTFRWKQVCLWLRPNPPSGMGSANLETQLDYRVELPLALGVILTGVRLATVIGVGLATIAAAIGAGGLGMFIFRGLAMLDSRLILAGAIPAATMALAADLILGRVEQRFGARPTA